MYKRISRILIETDSSQVVNLIHGHPEESHPYLSFILECKRLHTKLWNSPILYAPRNCNGCAHRLAYMGRSKIPSTNVVWFDVVPDRLIEAVNNDMYIYS